jgi:hypothetical protein
MPGSFGQTDTQDGVTGTSTTGRGVAGESASQAGVVGTSHAFVGVWGENESPAGAGQPGVFGKSPHGQGVHGESTDQAGVAGFSTNFVGVWGESQTAGQPGVFGKGPTVAGRFEGDVAVTGSITVTGDIVLANADCAEDFDLSPVDGPTGTEVQLGMVVVLDHHGTLCASTHPYDKRVAGVVSGAGDYKPGVILDRNASSQPRVPVALLGKVYCHVDAADHPIEVGDLLTTSARPGHAMKASDPAKAFGAVLGKALRSLSAGQGLIPVLVALQ